MCKCLIFKMYIYYRKFWGEKYLADCSNYGTWWILLWQFKQDSYSPTSIVQCSLAVEILVDCSQNANLPNKFPAKFPAVHIYIYVSSLIRPQLLGLYILIHTMIMEEKLYVRYSLRINIATYVRSFLEYYIILSVSCMCIYVYTPQ